MSNATEGSELKYYVCRLLPPRPTFAQDMSAEERTVMQAHVGYWMEHLAAGRVVVFGPVADPKGGWGIGIVRVANDAAVRELEANDPTVKSGLGFRYEILPMVRALVAG
jgi:uncharacterized protein